MNEIMKSDVLHEHTVLFAFINIIYDNTRLFLKQFAIDLFSKF